MFCLIFILFFQICKHFLEAVEKSKYGWFWECPSGAKCIYRHALPPGFELKKDKKLKEDSKNKISLEDLIERERAALGPKQTKITLETFIAWKKRKIQEKIDQAKKDEDKKRSDYKAGRQVGLSGREMFSFNPDLADDGDMEDGDEVVASYARSEDGTEDNDNQYRELNLDAITLEACEVIFEINIYALFFSSRNIMQELISFNQHRIIFIQITNNIYFLF